MSEADRSPVAGFGGLEVVLVVLWVVLVVLGMVLVVLGLVMEIRKSL